MIKYYYLLGDGPTRPYFGAATNKKLSDLEVIKIICESGKADYSLASSLDVFECRDPKIISSFNWIEHYFTF